MAIFNSYFDITRGYIQHHSASLLSSWPTMSYSISSEITDNDQYLKRFDTTNQLMCFYQIGFLNFFVFSKMKIPLRLAGHAISTLCPQIVGLPPGILCHQTWHWKITYKWRWIVHSHMLHVWNIYLHLPQKSTKCR